MLLLDDPYPDADAMETRTHQRYLYLRICAGLALAGFMVYGQMITHEFIRYDDHLYVFENQNVKKGLTPDSIVWAFTSFEVSNWHPLTWLSYIAECHFYGLSANPVSGHRWDQAMADRYTYIPHIRIFMMASCGTP